MTADPAGSISYITHEVPVWRPSNAYIAMVDLAPFGFENQQEQIWLRQLTENEFELCCIPFRVYGIALGDKVNLAGGRFVSSVLSRSGRRVLRVLFTDPRPPAAGPDSRDSLRSAIQDGGFLAEWSGDRHVAVDVPPNRNVSPLFAAVEWEIGNETAYWEWGDAEPFRTHG